MVGWVYHQIVSNELSDLVEYHTLYKFMYLVLGSLTWSLVAGGFKHLSAVELRLCSEQVILCIRL